MPDLPRKEIGRALKVVVEFFKRDWKDAWVDELVALLIGPLALADFIVGKEEEFVARGRGEILAEFPRWRDEEIWKSGTGPWVKRPKKIIEIVENTAYHVSNDREDRDRGGASVFQENRAKPQRR